MAYEKTVWVNGQAPALDADHLNKMEQGIADAVSVTPQSLTDDQKTQARTNINSAPGGFGLGGSPSSAYIATNGDDINATGWYVFAPQIAGFTFGYSLVRHEKYDGSYAVQTAYLFDATSGKGKNHVIRRVKESSTWYPWEWVNPPMQLGVEYRTTERYLGNPVYAKLINCGNLPGPGSTKNVSHGVSDCSPIMVTGRMSNANTIPWLNKFTVSADNINIVLYSAADATDFSSLTAMAILKYTKTTD